MGLFAAKPSLKTKSNVRHTRQKKPLYRQWCETLESRVLFSVNLTNADIAGTWNISGLGISGAVQFNASGQITTGSLVDELGHTLGLTGTYLVQSSGAALPGHLVRFFQRHG